MADADVTLTFHRSLYLPDVVRETAEIYAPYTESIDVSETEIEVIAVLKGMDRDGLDDAFANHVLFETVIRTRATLGSPA
jgi:hypothetical protein